MIQIDIPLDYSTVDTGILSLHYFRFGCRGDAFAFKKSQSLGF